MVPLSNWLNNQIIKSGFFAFSYLESNPKHLLSNWFLYSGKKNYLINKWKQKVIEYWNKNDKVNNYFIHHMIFKDLYNTDYVFKCIWDNSYKIDTRLPHYIQHPNTFTKNEIIYKLSDKVKEHIDNIKSPIYKLTYKYNHDKYNINSNLSYLINDYNTEFFKNKSITNHINFKNVFLLTILLTILLIIIIYFYNYET